MSVSPAVGPSWDTALSPPVASARDRSLSVEMGKAGATGLSPSKHL